MTTETFIHEAEGYYGRYNPMQLKYVVQWLDKRTTEELPYLWAEVLKALSPVYRTPPGVKELEDAWKIVRTQRMQEIYPPRPQITEERMPEAEAKKYFDIIRDTLGWLRKQKRASK